MMQPEDRQETIFSNLRVVREKIDLAAKASGREADAIKLVAITKTWSPDEIAIVIENGITVIGENRIQEALPKIDLLNKKFTNLSWHMVGHLQSNKVRPALETFDCIQAVDSLKLASRISEIAFILKKQIDILLEVNISGEISKYGFPPENVLAAVEKMIQLPGVKIKGLMTIGPLTSDRQRIKASFQKMKNIYDGARSISGRDFNVLSMGMSDDYDLAIEAGSTMVRLGRAIFGSRN